jgi:lipoyl(octanoyl) transferase
VNTDLKYFDYIVPCGITDKAVTSMELELGEKQDMHEVRSILKEKIAEQFGMEWL